MSCSSWYSSGLRSLTLSKYASYFFIAFTFRLMRVYLARSISYCSFFLSICFLRISILLFSSARFLSASLFFFSLSCRN
jgi:hypothetical protein